MALKQESRWCGVDTPLGPDKLVLKRFLAEERLSEPFEYRLELLSEDLQLDALDLLGKACTVRVWQPSTKADRYFNGIVTELARTETRERYASYRAVLHPWFWLLTRRSDCRVFQEQSVPDIVAQIFSTGGFADHSLRLNRSYEKRDYSVQYGESDFAFVSRLLEQEGIYYYFEHDQSRHTLVVCDDVSVHKSASGYESIPLRPPTTSASQELELVSSWERSQSVQSGTFTLNDYDFKRPDSPLEANRKDPAKHPYGDLERYEYPGGYLDRSQGELYAGTRLQEQQSSQSLFFGETNAVGLAVGNLFSLRDSDKKGDVMIVSTHIEFSSNPFASTSDRQSDEYRCLLTAIDGKRQFRPPRRTPKARMPGPQSAEVVGASEEEIWTDEHGRVKVQFRWDREGRKDENSSCWLRVAQLWAGAEWGALFLPRVGQEVIVDFLDGDPDRPLVTGCVYNGNNKPPYPLPDHQTLSTIKSNTSPDGDGSNELAFEDKTDSELLYLHAARNFDVEVEQDSHEKIGGSRHHIVASDAKERIGGSNHLTVLGNRNESVGATLSVSVGAKANHRCGHSYALEAGTEVHIKGGANVVIEAGATLTLKAGSGFVVIGPTGVAISGPQILLNSGGAAGAGSGCSPGKPDTPDEPQKPGE